MKILLIQPGYAHYRKKLFEKLSKRHGLTILFTNKKNTYPGAIEHGNYRHYTLKKKGFIKPLEYFLTLIKIRPEIIISSISTSCRSLTAYLYCMIFKKKFILWIIEWKEHPNNINIVKNILRKAKYSIGRYLIRKCDALIVGGTASKKFAKSIGKKDEHIFHAIQCSNDLMITHWERNINKERPFTYLYLSRIVPRKGLDILIKAFKLLKDNGSNARLVVGGDGSFSKYCERLVRFLNVPDVFFLGPIDPKNIGILFRLSDVFVFPCHFNDPSYEPWGLVINEALSMGIPVITTRAAGASYDLIQHNFNGIIVKDNSVLDLYNGMLQITKSNLVFMGKNARYTFEKINNFDKMADGFTKAIESLK